MKILLVLIIIFIFHVHECRSVCLGICDVNFITGGQRPYVYVSGPPTCYDKSADLLHHGKIWNTPTHEECKIGSREYKHKICASMVCAVVRVCVLEYNSNIAL